MSVPFDQASTPAPQGGGRYHFGLTEDWFGFQSAHGGFLAGVLLRAMQAEVGDAARHPRALTVHFAAAVKVGEVDIDVREERRGGRLSTVSARMTQEGAVMAVALGALSARRDGPDINDAPAPEVAPPEALEPLPGPGGFTRNLEYRRAIGAPPFSGSDRAETGGWLRFAEPSPIDAAAVACLADAWMPAIFSRIDHRAFVPTVDLTVHFRTEFPIPSVGPGDFVLARFRSRRAEGGFWEEDGELWSRDGRLLAQSRQLALVIPVR